MARWPWIERKFNFDFPVGKFPDIVERVRGTPARVAALTAGLSAAALTLHDGRGWSIQENVGHLLDADPLMMTRVEEILAGAEVLTPADMSGRPTTEANHNARRFDELFEQFSRTRATMVERFDGLRDKQWAMQSLHPRLNKPMRMIDLAYFVAEHDDYHLARISELAR